MSTPPRKEPSLFQEPNPLIRPRNTTSPQIVSHIREVYKQVYTLGKKLAKADKLGIHQTLETKMLQVLELAITASYTLPANKKIYLEKLRTIIDICQHLLRTEHELGIVTEKVYIRYTSLLIEISKQTSGWIKSIDTKNR